ncbi:HAMP domain-containing sensor histidine kinase [Desulfitobacterium chlororespirans]|uniref:Heme sensor protein HssS n=1 Tax=Desulfitobacterium chlororespirans DSM 11544 TaxID=1121395 RepID=A0A1M7TGF8_9FIRM|nr:HAMP domain-containing sensor histidine kinase [Desulfitobacterium chlororespirans]SHN69771.1 Signal transduction histidine kinase [Desulfitobacterium chlororespirans DSM 11544]
MIKKISRSIRAKSTLIALVILCFSCAASLGLATGYYTLFLNDGRELAPGTLICLLAGVVVACSVIGFILLYFAAKFISDPLIHMSTATKEIAKGNFDVVIEHKSEDELGILAKNFTLMAAELKTMEYLRKDFMSNVSHEFKTPIASIQGFVEMLQDRNLSDEEFDQYTQIIIEETSRLNRLCSNMLKMSRLDNQVIYDKSVSFSLDEHIRKVVLLLEEQWSKKNLDLDIYLEPIMYWGDPELLQQLWMNLIENGIKFSPEHRTITITAKELSTTILVNIADEGIGIAEENVSRIFEKFYQADTSHAQAGNGLGLAIVKRIVELCGGTIQCESKPGAGTTFTVILPK